MVRQSPGEVTVLLSLVILGVESEVIRRLEELLAEVVAGEMKPGAEQGLDLVRGQPLARPSVLGQRLEDARALSQRLISSGTTSRQSHSFQTIANYFCN